MMELFDYSALETSGKRRKGTIAAANAREARAQLRAQRLSPLEITPARRKSGIAHGLLRARVSNSDLVRATRQLAFLLEGGMPVEAALKNTASQFEKSPLRGQLLDIRGKVLDGEHLSQALRGHEDTFDGAYQAMVLAGETSGQLAGSFTRLSTRLEAARQLRGKVIAALAYPLALSTVAIVVVTIMMVVVVPKVVQQFDSFGQELPWLTRAVVGLSHWLEHFGLLLLTALAAAGFAFWRWLRTETGQSRAHGFFLRIPLIGRFMRDLNAARFARTMSGLLESGTPLISALQAAAPSIRNAIMRDAVTRMQVQVREGMSLHRALQQAGVFPDIVTQMVAGGEASGKLAASFGKSAEFLESEFENTSSVLLSLLEPAILVTLGGVILLIIAAIFLPILQLSNLVH